MITEKTCTKCATSKPIENFYKNASTKDGYQAWCKPCWKDDIDARIARDPEKRRRVDLASFHRNKIANPRTHHAQPYTDKVKARRALQGAVRRGQIVRQPCSVCGKPKADAHHADYSKPLDVEWFCRKCHAAEHRQLENSP